MLGLIRCKKEDDSIVQILSFYEEFMHLHIQEPNNRVNN
jgi:hypothetical protein